MNEASMLNLVSRLDWGLSEEVQRSAFNEILNSNNIDCSILIQPNQKSTWHNAVLLIKELGYPRNRKALPKLIWLLQDLNWPGSTTALIILSELDRSSLLPIIENGIRDAYKLDDFIWLGGIKELVLRSGIKKEDFTEGKVYELLAYADF